MAVLSPECTAGRNSKKSPCRVELAPAGPGGARVVRLFGAPGMRDVRCVREAIAAALLDAPTAIVVDVSGVEYLDGDGVMLLILMRRQARRLGPTLPLAGAAPAVARSLRMLDLNGLFHLHATIAEAIRASAVRARPGPRHRSRVACAERATAARAGSLSSCI